jgi:hypothetical protein
MGLDSPELIMGIEKRFGITMSEARRRKWTCGLSR